MGRRTWAILATLGLTVPIGTVVTATPAAATPVVIPLDCEATTPIGAQPADQDIAFDTTAPAQVLNGAVFTVSATAPAGTIPADFGGYTVGYVKDFRIKIPVPANSTYVGSSLTGGTVAGTVGLVGSNVQVDIPGPIPGGSGYQFPTVNVDLTSSGVDGALIQPKIGGTSFASPGFELTARVLGIPFYGDTDVPVDCFPMTPNPALSTTTIVPPDVTAPSVTITSPADSATYPLGSTILADYACDDGLYGSGVAYCTGDVADGAAIDTSTAGLHTFTVSADDNDGNGPTVVVNSYTVSGNPTIAVRGGWANEGPPTQQVPFTLTLSRPAESAASIDWQLNSGSATEGVDFVDASGTAAIAIGDRTATVLADVTDDSDYEWNEDLELELTSATNAIIVDATETGRILDDDQPAFRVSGGDATEGPAAQADFTVQLDGHTNVPVTIDYLTTSGTATEGTDFTDPAGSVIFNPGDPLSQTVSVAVADDGDYEDVEVFSLDASNSANAESHSAPGTIVDDESAPVRVDVGDVSVRETDEGKVAAKAAVTLDRPATSQVLVTYSTADGTASAVAGDYKAKIAKTVKFKVGQVSKPISITVNPDIVNEGDEDLSINLASATGGAVIGDGSATVTIVDDDNPTAGTPEISIGDATINEGDTTIRTVRVPVVLSQSSFSTITVQYATAGSSATSGFDFTAKAKTLTFAPTKVKKTVSIKVNADNLDEGDEVFVINLSSASGATIADGQSNVTIVDDDNAPSAPQNLAAATSYQLGGVDLTWDAPLDEGDGALSGYDYRVDSGAGFGSWTSTGTGVGRSFTHACGAGVSCTYEVRATNANGAGPASNQATATGADDTDAPGVTIVTPADGSNHDSQTAISYDGDAGTDAGDVAAVDVNVYACAGCTNIAPTQAMSATVLGGSWSATAPAALSPGVYTVQALQDDWNANTGEDTIVIEVRDAVFVAADGNDADPGTAAAPKLTVQAGVDTAVIEGRPQVAVGQGTFDEGAGVALATGVSVLGGFDSYNGWTRPGTAGQVGLVSNTLTTIEGAPQAAVADGDTGVTLDGLQVSGRSTGLAAGSDVYGLRATNGADVTLVNAKARADAGVAGDNGSNGSDGWDGWGGWGGSNGFEPCSGSASAAGGVGGVGANGNGRNGGAGGNGRCDNSGTAGTQGIVASPGLGGAGGAGGAKAGTGLDGLYCKNAPSGVAGGGGAGGAVAADGHGGGGGGGGGGAPYTFLLCPDRDTGGGGGGGGGGGTAGTSATSGTAGGSSYAVHATIGSSVTIDADSTAAAGGGAAGGSGGEGGEGGAGGAGGQGGTVTNGSGSGNSCTGCPDSGAGAGGGGGGGGGGGNAGSGADGGESISVYTDTPGTITDLGAVLAHGSGGTGGSGGSAGLGGAGGAGGAVATGAWSPAANAGVAGATGANGASGAAGTSGASCSFYESGTCITP